MIGIVIFTVTALILSIILTIVEDKFGSEKEEKVLSFLPNYNCGKCGYSGCLNLADAIIEDTEKYKKCKFMKEKDIKELLEYLSED